MITIWKEQFKIRDEFTINLPKDHRMLKVGTQNNVPTMWFMCSSESPKVEFTFRVFGTGMEIYPSDEENLLYISTFEVLNMVEADKPVTISYIWHLFLVTPKQAEAQDGKGIQANS